MLLPLELTRNQFRFGFEGVAAAGGYVYVAFQRAWTDAGDPADRARIGRYDPSTGTSGPSSTTRSTRRRRPTAAGSACPSCTHLGGDEFAVIERDDQGGPDASVKRIYAFSIAGVTSGRIAEVPGFDVLGKSLAIDLLVADVYGPTGGPIPEKLEGLAVLADGTASHRQRQRRRRRQQRGDAAHPARGSSRLSRRLLVHPGFSRGLPAGGLRHSSQVPGVAVGAAGLRIDRAGLHV